MKALHSKLAKKQHPQLLRPVVVLVSIRMKMRIVDGTAYGNVKLLLLYIILLFPLMELYSLPQDVMIDWSRSGSKINSVRTFYQLSISQQSFF